MFNQALIAVSLNRSSTTSRTEAKVRPRAKSLLLRCAPAELLNILGIKKISNCLHSALCYCGMVWSALFGGGGGMSSESAGCLRDCAWAHRSKNSKRIAFVTGCWILLHTAVRTTRDKMRTYNRQWIFSRVGLQAQKISTGEVVSLFMASYFKNTIQINGANILKYGWANLAAHSTFTQQRLY